MGNIKLDTILLFALVVPFIMTYRIGPGDTPYWLFGLIFLGLLLNVVVDLLKMSDALYNRVKHIPLVFLIIAVIGGAFFSAIVVRHQTHPIYMIHDMPLQQEIAIRYLVDGRNPYATNYFGTFLEQWHYSDKEVNPALYHFVLMPFYVIFALPFYFLSNNVFGYFDARLPLLFLFGLLLTFAYLLPLEKDKKRLFLVLLAFNPAMLGFILEGRSDIFMFSFMFASFFFLYKQRYTLAGIPMALAFAVKQSAWPIIPFYLAYLYFKTHSIGKTVQSLLPFAATFVLIVLPFFLWDLKAFLDSTVFYLSGGTPHSYPISGYGLGRLLLQTGHIADVHQYYPFHVWQIVIGIPAIFFLIRFLKKSPSIARLIISYGIFLFVFWYFSRYFNNSHLGFLSLIFITAYFWPDKKGSAL